MIRNQLDPSPAFFMVARQDAPEKKNPIEAPIELISTNHPRASLPNIGPDKEMAIQKSNAFFGVPYLGSTFPKILGIYRSRAIEFIRRLDAR